MYVMINLFGSLLALTLYIKHLLYVLHNPCVIFHVVDYMKTWIKDLNYISEVYFVIQTRGTCVCYD